MDLGQTIQAASRMALSGIRDARAWRATGYVVVSFFTLLAIFVLTLPLVVVMFPLTIIVVGWPVVTALLRVIHWFVGFPRRRADWVGGQVQVRPLTTGSIRERMKDRVAWRHVGFALTAWLVTTLLFIAMVIVWAGPLYLLSIPLWGWALDTPWTRLVAMPVLGLGLLLLAPWPARGIGYLLRQLVEAWVGPDRVLQMEQQVAEISESRSDILTAVAGERQRIERNLHDGVQQQLVALGIDLGLAEAKLESDPEAARALLNDATQKARASIGVLRTIGRGLHPAVLGDRGLDAALSAVVANSSIPVELRTDLMVDPPAAVAEAAYFVVSEAMANIMKHSKANIGVVEARSTVDELAISIYDDGCGGATTTGTGLAGMAARVRGFDGSFHVKSPVGGPTVIDVVFPLAGQQ